MLQFQFFLETQSGKRTVIYEFHKFLSGKTSITVDGKEVLALPSLAKSDGSKHAFQPIECTFDHRRMVVKVSVTESAEMGFYLYTHDIYIDDQLLYQLTS